MSFNRLPERSESDHHFLPTSRIRPIFGPISLRRQVLRKSLIPIESNSNGNSTNFKKKNDENVERQKFLMQRMGIVTALDELSLETKETEKADRALFIQELMLTTIQDNKENPHSS
jgi:hypothetical protein